MLRIPLGVLAAVLLAGAGPAAADALDRQCHGVDGGRDTSCSLEKGSAWHLTTAVTVGGAGAGRVEALERRFCETVRRLGVPGRITRRSDVPGQAQGGATWELACDLPDVAARP